jgi:hypothetical protein
LLLPFGEFFHPLQRFLLRYGGPRRALDFNFFRSFQLFHNTSTGILLWLRGGWLDSSLSGFTQLPKSLSNLVSLSRSFFGCICKTPGSGGMFSGDLAASNFGL